MTVYSILVIRQHVSRRAGLFSHDWGTSLRASWFREMGGWKGICLVFRALRPRSHSFQAVHQFTAYE